MHRFRIARRLHALVVALTVAAVVVTGCLTGCSYQIEEVTLPNPHRAWVAGDGTLLMSFYLKRELQPDYSGWHWLAVEPETAMKLTQPIPTLISQYGKPYQIDHVSINFDDCGTNAALDPPLLDPGLPEPGEVPSEHRELTEWSVVEQGEFGVPHLHPMSDTGPIVTPQMVFYPYSTEYQTERGRISENIAKTLAFPFRMVGRVLLFPVLLVVALMWVYS